MRHEFRKEMSLLEDTLKLQAREAANAMKRAAASLKDANLALAESVIDADHHIDFLERNVDEMGISLLARQAPVASGLRTATDGPAYDLLTKMADQAPAVGKKVSQLVETQDLALAKEIEDDDEILDDYHRQSCDLVLDESNQLSRQEVVDGVLLARFLERYGVHAVSVARRMTFLVTGIAIAHDGIPGTEEEMLG